MSSWKVVAEGTNLTNLSATVGDMEFPKGTRMRVTMDVLPGFEHIFDLAGMELMFKAATPSGWDILDVWGENGQGIVEMEADPAWLIATLVFLKAHWLALTIIGIVVFTIVSLIVITVKVPAIAAIPIALVVGAAMGVIGLLLLSRGRSP